MGADKDRIGARLVLGFAHYFCWKMRQFINVGSGILNYMVEPVQQAKPP
jgi:hypothetical protein